MQLAAAFHRTKIFLSKLRPGPATCVTTLVIVLCVGLRAYAEPLASGAIGAASSDILLGAALGGMFLLVVGMVILVACERTGKSSL